MSVGAGFARDDVFRPKRWLPKPETSYHLNAQLGVRKRFVSFYSAGFAAIDPGVLLARRKRPAFRKRLARARRRPLSCRPARLQWCLILDICAADGLNFPAIIRRGPVRLVDLIPDAEVLCALEQRAGRPPKCRAFAGLLLYARPAREASRLPNSLVTVEKFVMHLYMCSWLRFRDRHRANRHIALARDKGIVVGCEWSAAG